MDMTTEERIESAKNYAVTEVHAIDEYLDYKGVATMCPNTGERMSTFQRVVWLYEKLKENS